MVAIADFVGTYLMCHDGWNGTLSLSPRDTGPHFVDGTYADSTGRQFSVQLSITNHEITFYVLGLGGQNADSTGGQKFYGHLMTQTKDAIAGTTWWQGRPFGFYAVKA